MSDGSATHSALMLALPEDAARAVLEGTKKQEWEFSQYTGRGGC